jgi:hypothetical protein
VDTFDSKTFPEHSSRDFVESIWFPKSNDDAQRVWKSGIPVSLLGSAMLLYETLDTLLWVYDWPKSPTLSLQRPRTAFPKNLSEHFEKAIKLVNNWPSLMENITPNPNSASTPNVTARNVTSDYEAALHRFCAGLDFEKKSDFEQACAHIHNVGFVFYWLAYVSCCRCFILPLALICTSTAS